METKVTISVRPSTDEIARIAYSLWEQEGRPSGRDQEHWLKAEAQLRAPAVQSAKKQVPATPPAPAKVSAPAPAVKPATPALAPKAAAVPTVAVAPATPPALSAPQVSLPKGKRKGRRV